MEDIRGFYTIVALFTVPSFERLNVAIPVGLRGLNGSFKN